MFVATFLFLSFNLEFNLETAALKLKLEAKARSAD